MCPIPPHQEGLMKAKRILAWLIAAFMAVALIPALTEPAAAVPDNNCPICGYVLYPAPNGAPIPPAHERTEYSCYHEYEGGCCPLCGSGEQQRHYHFYYPSNPASAMPAIPPINL